MNTTVYVHFCILTFRGQDLYELQGLWNKGIDAPTWEEGPHGQAGCLLSSRLLVAGGSALALLHLEFHLQLAAAKSSLEMLAHLRRYNIPCAPTIVI